MRKWKNTLDLRDVWGKDWNDDNVSEVAHKLADDLNSGRMKL